MAAATLLCIETALSGCSVCLGEHENSRAQVVSTIPNSASEKLNTMIADVLQTTHQQFSDIRAIAVSSGPGSYTGLRIGMAAAKGLAYALQIPMITISTLQIIAAAAKYRYQLAADVYVTAIDARRNEIFCAIYDNDLHLLMKEQPLIPDEKFKRHLDVNQKIILAGNGAYKLGEFLNQEPSRLHPEIAICAEDMIRLAQNAFQSHAFCDIAYTEPNYTKDFYYPSARLPQA